MHGTQPAFGSLFTACLLALVFVKGARKVWPMVLAIHLGMFVWFYMSSYERYLVVFVPWMAAVVSICVALAWRQGGFVVRVGAIALVAAQLAGQADLPFIGTHRMNGAQPTLIPSVSLLGAGYRADVESRLRVFSEWEELGDSLPLDAVVLIHLQPLRLGINRDTVDDLQASGQYGLSYGKLGDVAAIDRRLKELGVTHVAYTEGIEDNDSLAGELLFQIYAKRFLVRPHGVRGWTVGALPDRPPPPGGDRVLVVACSGPYRTGLYRMEDLTLPRPLPGAAYPAAKPPVEEAADPASLVARADHLAIDPTCPGVIDAGAFFPLGRRRAPPAMDLFTRIR
jgi:hypothetical protein